MHLDTSLSCLLYLASKSYVRCGSVTRSHLPVIFLRHVCSLNYYRMNCCRILPYSSYCTTLVNVTPNSSALVAPPLAPCTVLSCELEQDTTCSRHVASCTTHRNRTRGGVCNAHIRMCLHYGTRVVYCTVRRIIFPLLLYRRVAISVYYARLFYAHLHCPVANLAPVIVLSCSLENQAHMLLDMIIAPDLDILHHTYTGLFDTNLNTAPVYF